MISMKTLMCSIVLTVAVLAAPGVAVDEHHPTEGRRRCACARQTAGATDERVDGCAGRQSPPVRGVEAHAGTYRCCAGMMMAGGGMGGAKGAGMGRA